MCGIVGIVDRAQRTIPTERIARLTETLKHRGPDDSGVFVEGSVALGHTRLSILDLSHAGHQPMQKAGVTLVYNGEIYNFATLRQELVSKGATFRSRSDTEVVLEAFLNEGAEAFARFEGMFACAIYDARDHKLYLARDRFGIKPLFVYEDDDSLLFASELRTLLADAAVHTTLDPEAIREYFQLHYIRHPKTPFTSIRKVKPGTVEIFDLRRRTHRYVTLPSDATEPITIERQRAVEQTRALLEESVAAHMVSDVEVGVLLSGGVDSGMIGAIAAQKSDKPLHAFSVAFQNEALFDESAYAKAVAKRYGMRHHIVYAEMHALDEQLDRAVATMDEPLADSSVFLTHAISAYAKEHVKVVLSGLGGDELFGGYNRHRAWILQRYLRRIPGIEMLHNLERRFATDRTSPLGNRIRLITKLLASVGEDANETYGRMIAYLPLQTIDLGIRDGALEEVLRYDRDYYMCDNLLAFSDRISMAYGLEVRTPFLYRPLAAFAASLPEHYKATWRDQKIILKQAAEAYMPKSAIYRRKQGFAAPVERWLRHIGKEHCRAMIDCELVDAFIAPYRIEEDIEAFFDRRIDRSMQLYAAIVLTRWHQSMKEYA